MNRQDCAAQHFGLWAIEPKWFAEAVVAVREGRFPMVVSALNGPLDESESLYDLIEPDIAVVSIAGHMIKGLSSYGGTSTVRTRQALRKAAADSRIGVIALRIDSPGGTAAGTPELAAVVKEIDTEIKPVYAYIEDEGASAAYWVASQARSITANATAFVGSIGCLMILEDTSKAADQKGLRVNVVSTGAYKGAFVEGTPITPEQLAYAQETVDDVNKHFLYAIQDGRKLPKEDVMNVSDGRVWIAGKAWSLRLIDHIKSYDDFVNSIRPENRRQRRHAADVRLRIDQMGG